MSQPIKCPVCESSISSDGRTIYKHSEKVKSLESLRRQIPELRKRIEALEQGAGIGRGSGRGAE